MAKVKNRVFTVEWNADRGRYVALDENRDLLGVSDDLTNAIGSGVREANLASKAGVAVKVMVKDRINGKARHEYTAQPAPKGAGEVRYRRQSGWRRASQ